MKFTMLALSFAFILFLSPGCKKSNPEVNQSGSFVGSWELRLIQGSIPSRNFAPGNGHIIQFTNDGYKVLDSGRVKEEGHFTITPDSSVEANVCLEVKAGQFTNRITFSASSNPNKVFYNIEGNRLTFLSGCFALDGGSSKMYERVEAK